MKTPLIPVTVCIEPCRLDSMVSLSSAQPAA